MSDEAALLLGTPRTGGILIVSDHASNRVPAGVDLGIDPALLHQHIAVDIGVAGVATIMAQHEGIAAWLGNVSRLVCDLNRDESMPDEVFPAASDGYPIPGNSMDPAQREDRLARYYRPYHTGLAAVLAAHPPALILSLHSFTPGLSSRPDEARPWHIGILYNADERAARIAIPLLAAQGLCVGDQQPYSGRELNASMDRHGEGTGLPYLGVEIRQDLIGDSAGQAEWAKRMLRLCPQVVAALG